jgi:hypothetical protein
MGHDPASASPVPAGKTDRQSAMNIRIALISAAAVVALGGCSGSVEIGGRVLSGDELETQITDKLEEQVGQRPASVECPDEVEVEVGAAFQCTLTADDGTTLPVNGTVTDEEGGFEIEVGEATPAS